MISGFEAVIGLEVHAQLMTASKAFCFAPAEFGASENSRVGSVSAGLPGALPVLNSQAVELAIRAGLALNCNIAPVSIFARKNYFYPDLPKGYQISQFDLPLCTQGHLDISLSSGGSKRIGIERIHMEEDAGKSTHLANFTLINLNRAGVPLVEIVSRPEIHNAEEAVAYLKKLHQILVFSKVTDGNMEEGNFRCDVNVSIRPQGTKTLGTRTELKNINSFRFVEKALEYEIARQVAVVQSGGRIIQETRGWDAAVSKTFSMRSKEEAQDYRYFPDPDLPPLRIDPATIERIRGEAPELPETKKARLIRDFGLTDYDATQITSDLEWAAFFEECLREGASAKLAANWLLSELLREMKVRPEASLKDSPISPAALARLLNLIEKKTISGKIAKEVFSEMFASGKDAETIVKDKGLVQVLDSSSIDGWVEEVLRANPSVVTEYLSGKEKVFAFLVGQVMKASRGKANPDMVSEALKKKLIKQ
jgi:aspartyl-tRNA(Asn)/glutamyl-tRNA(Gln) amidotransferase subunit B